MYVKFYIIEGYMKKLAWMISVKQLLHTILSGDEESDDDNLIQFGVSMLFFDKLIRNVKIESRWWPDEKKKECIRRKEFPSRQETKEEMSQ